MLVRVIPRQLVKTSRASTQCMEEGDATTKAARNLVFNTNVMFEDVVEILQVFDSFGMSMSQFSL